MLQESYRAGFRKMVEVEKKIGTIPDWLADLEAGLHWGIKEATRDFARVTTEDIHFQVVVHAAIAETSLDRTGKQDFYKQLLISLSNDILFYETKKRESLDNYLNACSKLNTWFQRVFTDNIINSCLGKTRKEAGMDPLGANTGECCWVNAADSDLTRTLI